MDVFNIFLGPETLASTIRLSVPLILCCLAGLWSERSGIVDIGLEGKMLAGAFAAAATASVLHSEWMGLIAAIAVSVAFALIHGYASIGQRGNQVVSGVAINMLAAGLALVLGNTWFGEGGRTPPLAATDRFMELSIPGAAAI
jgi:general nucleoside transport system permease protein